MTKFLNCNFFFFGVGGLSCQSIGWWHQTAVAEVGRWDSDGGEATCLNPPKLRGKTLPLPRLLWHAVLLLSSTKWKRQSGTFMSGVAEEEKEQKKKMFLQFTSLLLDPQTSSTFELPSVLRQSSFKKSPGFNDSFLSPADFRFWWQMNVAPQIRLSSKLWRLAFFFFLFKSSFTAVLQKMIKYCGGWQSRWDDYSEMWTRRRKFQ